MTECKHGKLTRQCYVCDLEAELASARVDAARYRWLRAEHNPPGLPLAQVVWKQSMDRNSSEWVNTINSETLDRDIDDAMAKEPTDG